MLISMLEYRHGAMFNGTYRVRHPYRKVAENGSPCHYITLEDLTGEIKGYSWTNEAVSSFNNFDCVNLSGKIRDFNNSWIVNVLDVELLKSGLDQPLALIPRSICPLPDLIDRLDALVNLISHEALRHFVISVLADDAISFPFISLPASRQHHHCISGGLLEHSLECVAMVSRFVEFQSTELELALIGALFHDIGKIKTLKSIGKLTSTGFVCDHDALTLEVLASHLQSLDEVCPDAGIALRYLWTWRNGRKHNSIPLLTIAEAIIAADRISSGLNVQEAAFRDLPEWRNFAQFGENNKVWRPRLVERI